MWLLVLCRLAPHLLVAARAARLALAGLFPRPVLRAVGAPPLVSYKLGKARDILRC